jgi:hypothetical protein
MPRRLQVIAGAAMALACVTGFRACMPAEEWPGPKSSPSSLAPAQPPPPAKLGTITMAHPRGPHPRLLLNADHVAGLRGLRAASAPSWRRLATHCDQASAQTIDAGYEAWDWVNATLDLALCYSVTHREQYLASAIKYFRATLDDGHKVGDGAGGDNVVHHDDGYSIRTRGCFGAVAYDWLHDFAGFTPELRTHAVDRLVAWTKWFSENGYNRDEPIANYYMGFFGAVAFGAIATDGDDPRSVELLHQAQRMYAGEIVPAFEQKLVGGDFPEGWQYGDMVGAVLAIFADAEARGEGGRSPFDDLSWLSQVVAYRAHALWPDGKHMFDTGDWSNKPAVAPAHALLSLAMVLPEHDAGARRARALAKLAEDPDEEWLWLAALEDDPSRLAEDPRLGPTSYLGRGTAAITARTDWSPRAVWVGLTSAPSLSDHQHLDAGHFEIVRGSDALVVDSGGYGSYSSLSHNVIAVDDRKESSPYSPNQGTWSDSAHWTRFEDAGRFVYGMADYTSAYNPPGYPKDHPQRSVSRAQREVFFSRTPVLGVDESARVIISDRITLTKPSYGVTFLLHGGSTPEMQARGARILVGKSAAYLTTVIPRDIAPLLVHEPTDLGDGPFFANEPPEGTTSDRIEVRSSSGGTDRRFLHALVVTSSDGRAASAIGIDGNGGQGLAIDDEAYLFALDGEGHTTRIEYQAPLSAVRHYVMSLAPGSHYTVVAVRDADRCRVTLVPSQPSGGRAASTAGILALEMAPGCALR